MDPERGSRGERGGGSSARSKSPDPELTIEQLLARGMSQQLHWFGREVSAARLAAVLAGMANTRGGQVLIGVAPRSGQVLGVGEPGELFDLVFEACLMVDPPLVLPLPRLIPLGELKLLQVSVPDGLPHVYNLDGRYLWREAAQTNPIPARQLRRLLLQRGLVQFESQVPPGASLEDLDPEKVQAYLAATDLPGGETWQHGLLRRGCLLAQPDGLRPTYAALALFGRMPQRWLPGATILAARFSGPSFTDQFIKQEISATLPEQLIQAERFVRENLRRVVQLAGLVHQERFEYPLEAVRELLVNAVAHRDYNLQGDSIHINIFSDRLEIQSPGGLPGPVTLENLLAARFSRNAVIVQALADLGYVERLGYGLDRVIQTMRQAGLRPPLFEEIAGTFRVTLFTAPQAAPGQAETNLEAYRALGLNQRQESLLIQLSRQGRVTNREYQELCPEVHPETLRRDLAELVRRGMLIKVGDKKATYYILKKAL